MCLPGRWSSRCAGAARSAAGAPRVSRMGRTATWPRGAASAECGMCPRPWLRMSALGFGMASTSRPCWQRSQRSTSSCWPGEPSASWGTPLARRKAKRALRPWSQGSRLWIEWAAPRTITNAPRGFSRAHSNEVERSWSPAKGRTGASQSGAPCWPASALAAVCR